MARHKHIDTSPRFRTSPRLTRDRKRLRSRVGSSPAAKLEEISREVTFHELRVEARFLAPHRLFEAREFATIRFCWFVQHLPRSGVVMPNAIGNRARGGRRAAEAPPCSLPG